MSDYDDGYNQGWDIGHDIAEEGQRERVAELEKQLSALQLEREALRVDAMRYRWLNKQDNFMLYMEDAQLLRKNVRLKCGEPLNVCIDAAILAGEKS